MLTIFEELVSVAICSRSNLRSTGLVLGLQTLNTAPHTIHLGASSLSVDLAVQEAIKLATVVLMFLKC